MADHSELVAEMLALEQMGTQERQKLAKKRRLHQIKKWGQREREWLAKEKQMNKRLADRISEENNGLDLKHFAQYTLSDASPIKDLQVYRSSLQNSADLLTSNHMNETKGELSHMDKTLYSNNSSKLAVMNNVNGIINNNNLSRKNLNKSRSISLNGLDAKGLYTGSINSKVHFDAGMVLLEAAARNDFDEVRRLLMLGVNPDSTNHDGLTALHQSCIEASEHMIKLLLEFGANLDARDTEQWTPLHAACTCGHLNLVKILVENGADLLAVNGDGNMPFDLCEDEHTLDYLESQMLEKGITQEMIDIARSSTELELMSDIQRHLQNGTDINSIIYQSGVTPLHIAAANGYHSAVKFLLSQGANVDVCDNELWQPLHGVACWGNEQHIKIVELLIEAGASLDAKTINDETVIDLCDNEQLLDRLNEIKEELENKEAASEAGKLRRTQSRTNSRIHSIRRTSVRSKGQLSRRDALEEALLRSESNLNDKEAHPLKVAASIEGGDPQEMPEDDFTVGGDSDLVNTKIVQNELSSQDALADDKFSQTANLKLHQQQNTKLNDSDNSIMGFKQSLRQDSGIETSYISTDLDENINSELDSANRVDATRSKNNMIYQNGSQNSPESQDYHPVNNRRARESDGDNSRSMLTNMNPILNSKSQATFTKVNDQRTGLVPKRKSSQTNPPMDTCDEMNISNGKNRTSDTSQRQDQWSGQSNGSDNSNGFYDTSNSDAPVTTTSGSTVIVQFNSTNYTLSNLKKQRSDLRMRTANIGGHNNLIGSTIEASTKVRASTNVASQSNNCFDRLTPSIGSGSSSVMLDPKAMEPTSSSLSLLSIRRSNGLISSSQMLQHSDNRGPEIHDSSLRKFRGEPSELIGNCNGRRGRSCCTIM